MIDLQIPFSAATTVRVASCGFFSEIATTDSRPSLLSPLRPVFLASKLSSEEWLGIRDVSGS
jgi:hypothetical protein